MAMSRKSALKLAYARDPELQLGYGQHVRVPRGTKKVFLPRTAHYAPGKVFTEKDEAHLHSVGDVLEPCIVKRGAFGFGLHECASHNGRVMGQPVYYITESD